MRKIEKVALIGMGAMGAFFAPNLYKLLGDGFCLIASGDRKKRMIEQGYRINQVKYNFPICEPEEGQPVDLIILAVKDTGFDQAVRDIKKFVGPDTLLMPVLNGVDSERVLAQAYGWEHVLYAYMRVSIEMTNGVADFHQDFGKVYFGEPINKVISDRVHKVKALFDASNIPYHIPEDMIRGMWFKFMCNIGENMTCALLDIPYGAFLISESANLIREAAMREVLAIAKAYQVDLTEEDLIKQRETIQKIPKENRPSTLQDLRKGKMTEVAMFAGRVVEMGLELKIETPISWLFYHGIRVHEEKNKGIY